MRNFHMSDITYFHISLCFVIMEFFYNVLTIFSLYCGGGAEYSWKKDQICKMLKSSIPPICTRFHLSEFFVWVTVKVSINKRNAYISKMGHMSQNVITYCRWLIKSWLQASIWHHDLWHYRGKIKLSCMVKTYYFVSKLISCHWHKNDHCSLHCIFAAIYFLEPSIITKHLFTTFWLLQRSCYFQHEPPKIFAPIKICCWSPTWK